MPYLAKCYRLDNDQVSLSDTWDKTMAFVFAQLVNSLNLCLLPYLSIIQFKIRISYFFFLIQLHKKLFDECVSACRWGKMCVQTIRLRIFIFNELTKLAKSHKNSSHIFFSQYLSFLVSIILYFIHIRLKASIKPLVWCKIMIENTTIMFTNQRLLIETKHSATILSETTKI